MSLQSPSEVSNTLAKLARLEARYEALRKDTAGNQRVRELSMTSLKRLINQFKEEVARFNAGATNVSGRHQDLRNETELANTRDKLHILEARYEEIRQETGGDEELRTTELKSLKRFINQLKEEIARYEAHQAVRR